jgi:ComF family protein
VRAVVDVLVDERCHACGGAIGRSLPGPDRGPVPGLADPLRIHVGPFRFETRLLCDSCARRVRLWREAVRLADVGFASPARADSAGRAPLVVYPAFATGDVLLRLVRLLKFERRERVAPWLARAAAAGFPARALEGLAAPAVLVPVPMDNGSLRRRGFNQAERIALELGRVWGVPVAPRALAKIRRTPAQSSLGRTERARNLARAMAPGTDPVAGRSVLIVDDLVTTGATAAACAAILRGEGATVVRVVCVGYRP